MLIREALQQQAPSLALQRAAAAEIARLDAELVRVQDRHHTVVVGQVQPLRAALEAVVGAVLPAGAAVPSRMASFDAPWPQVAKALWP